MSLRKSTERSAHARRGLHLESFETRLALSAAEGPVAEFQFNGQIVQRWLDEQGTADTVVIAPAVPREISSESIPNLLTFIGTIDQRPNGTVTLEGVNNWLERRGVQFNFTTPATDGGFINLSGKTEVAPSGLGAYQKPSSSELFGAHSDLSLPSHADSHNEAAFSAATPTPSALPMAPAQSGGQGHQEILEVWSSLGRPAVIATGDTNSAVAGRTSINHVGAEQAGGWIALEPILAQQTDVPGINALRLASPETHDGEAVSAGLTINFNREDTLSGEWARATVFEIIGGDPSESLPTGGASRTQNIPLRPADPSISRDQQPSTPLGATTSIPAQAVMLLSGDGWLDEMADWMKTRTAAAIDALFATKDDDASEILGGWRDYAGAGVLVLAIALERLGTSYRDECEQTDVNRRDKLRLSRADFANRLTKRLRPMEAR
jgi:hypothetical protein